MGKTTKITWASHTWSPWRGCAQVSPGCVNCYAEALSARNPRILGEWGASGVRVLSARWSMDWIIRMEDAGYVTIDRPVHAATGIPLGIDQWTLEVSPEVADWFGRDGRLRQEYED